MAEYLIQDTTLTNMADAVRTKTGSTGALSPDGMATALNNIANRDSNNLSVSGATVTVPAGNYKAQATKSVATATQATPSVSVDANGKITASATQSAGYVAAGTKTGTKQLTTQAAKTVTPTESSQTAVASGIYTTGAVSVSPIPSEYIVREEISEQDTLISNIMTALEGKAGGGSSDGGSVETCTVEVINTTGIFWYIHYSYINESGVSVMLSGADAGETTELSNVIAFSDITIWSDNNAGGVPYEFEADGAYVEVNDMLGGETLAILQTYPENGNNVAITIM